MGIDIYLNSLWEPWFETFRESEKAKAIFGKRSGWRHAVCIAMERGIAAPAFSASLSYYDSYRSAQLPANLLQAQRDFFGAHTYERTDHPSGEFFHTEWLEG